MESGDISGEVAPRQVFVWEHLLATVAPQRERSEARMQRRHRYRSALALWEDHPTMRHRLHDLGWRQHQNVDILCTHGGRFGELLAERLDRTNYPHNRFLNLSLDEFSSELAYMPEVVAVYHCTKSAPFLFGGRGRLVLNPERMTL